MPTPREGVTPITDKDFTAHLSAEDRERLRQALVDGDFGTFEMFLQRGRRALKGGDLADFLAESAVIADLANRPELAKRYASEALKTALDAGLKTDDPGVKNLAALLRKVGGDTALVEVLGGYADKERQQLQVELDDVQLQYSEITDELVQLDGHDWKEQGFMYTEEERTAKLKELRAELQRLIGRRTDLRNQLGLGAKK